MSWSHLDEDAEPRREGLIPFLSRLVVLLIAFAAITIIICAFLPELEKQREQAARVEQLKSDVDKKRAELARSERELDLLKNDPEYVETIARDRLDLMKEGETVFRLDSSRQESARR